jgi:hypothetical protein
LFVGRVLLRGFVFGGDGFGGVMRFYGAFVRETGLLVSAEVIVHVVRRGCGFVCMGREAVNFGSVDVFSHGHSWFLW